MKRSILDGFLVLCFSAILFSALSTKISATDAELISAYKDADEIYYKEAVEVVSAVKIMEGYSNHADPPDHYFRPGSVLTRGAAAKIIANLAITPEYTSEYETRAEAKMFVDVNQDHVFRKHITYCYQQNLLSGYADHTFRPADKLTYNAFLKMLLCVLGHNQYTEGYTGDGWGERVQRDARNSGLLMGFQSSFYGGDFITREIAALFAFNAIQANQVYSSNGIAVPRVISTNMNSNKYKTIRDTPIRYSENNYDNEVVQFGEERFPDLMRQVLESGMVRWSLNVLIEDEKKEFKTICEYPDTNEFQSYVIYFDENYRSTNEREDIPSIVVINGGVFGELPSPPERRDYSFDGWFTQPYGGERVTSTSPVWLSGNITLYAHWTSGIYYVYFNVNGGTMGEDRMEIPADGRLSNLPTPFRIGYTFTGWYTSQQNGEPVRNGDTIPTASSLILYAYWRPRQYQVTFSASGVDVTPSSKIVTHGEMYGALPRMPPRGGIPFAGWFTSADANADKIEETSPVDLTANQILYAQWNPEIDISAYILTFKVDSFTHVTWRIPKGDQLTEWPSPPQKDNFEFKGWVESTIGETFPLPFTVNSNHVFDAFYDRMKICTLTFHSENFDQTQIPSPIEIEPGTQLQELPKLTPPSEDNRYFLGWYCNGMFVSTPLTVRTDMDLYAAWASPLSHEDFAYQFENSIIGFNYPSTFTWIPPDRYGLIFGDNTLAKEVYKYDCAKHKYRWRGNCYGMTTTAGMFQHPGNGVEISDFVQAQAYIRRPGDIHTFDGEEYSNPIWGNLTLKKFIEAMQISQNTIAFVRTYWENRGSLNGLCEEVAHISETNGGAVVVCIYQGDAGHALLCYYLEEHEDSSRIYVYDCNFPEEKLFINLTKDKNGNYTGWYYEKAREYGGEDTGVLTPWGSAFGGTITYIPYEKYYSIWQRRGRQDGVLNFLSTNLTDATIYDELGNRIASFRGGEIENPNDIQRNDVYPLVSLEENPENSSHPIAVWLPDSSEYRIQNNTADTLEQVISLSSPDRSVTVRTMASVVTLSLDKVNDADEIREADGIHIIDRHDEKLDDGIHVAIAERDENLQIQVNGVHLPDSVAAFGANNDSVSWSGATQSGMEFTLLISDESLNSLHITGNSENRSLSINGQDITAKLRDGTISLNDVLG